MEVSCEVIRDILALYAENMVSEETKKLVQRHVAGCSKCRLELETISTDASCPVDNNIGSLKRVELSIRSKRRWTVAAAVMLMLTLFVGSMVFLFVPVWIGADEAIAYVEKQSDGQMKFKTTKYTYGHYGMALNLGDGVNHSGFLYTMVRGRMLFPPQVPEQMNEASREGYFILGHQLKNGNVEQYAYDRNYYYIDYRDGSVEKVLWDAGYMVPNGSILAKNGFQSVSWGLEWFFLGAAILFVLSAAAWIPLGKKRGFAVAAEFFGSCAAASLLVTSGRFMTIDINDFLIKLFYIFLMTVLLFASVICIHKASRMKAI